VRELVLRFLFAVFFWICWWKVLGELAGPSGLNEGDSNSLLVSPCDAAWPFYSVAFDDENKIIGDSNRAGDLQTRTGKGQVANLAANDAALIKRNGRCF
jgi:hypothetical protein